MLSALAVTACAIVAVPLATPVTVTVRAVSQLAAVNVSDATGTVAVAAALLVSDTVTLPDGRLFRRMRYAAVVPAFSVSACGVTATP